MFIVFEEEPTINVRLTILPLSKMGATIGCSRIDLLQIILPLFLIPLRLN